MISYRREGVQEGAAPEINWESDRQYRMNPDVVSSLLREQVPALDFVQWRMVTIEPGFASSQLPLNPPSTNQHFTHQAAVLVLAADYTGGTALASLLTGWPVVGVHPVQSQKSVSLWLLKFEIKFIRPSVSDVTVSARIDPSRHDRIRQRFLNGKTVIETITIEFCSGDTAVAEATGTYFARQSEMLRAEGISAERVNTLYELKLTSSAELIAGVRARESGKLFVDPFAARMAGQHGMALASRFCERSPQLGGMVAARTRHLDSTMMEFAASGGRDIVIVGVGWDMRPFRLALPPGTRVYELDFPTTLAERRRRLALHDVSDPEGIQRITLPIDLGTMSLDSVLKQHLPSSVPVLIAWEGMSMYFEESEVLEILLGMASLLKHEQSRLWVDLVDQEAVINPERVSPSVVQFMRGMQVLGEPFLFGTDGAEDFVAAAGLECTDLISSDAYLPNECDPVYSIYKFCVARSKIRSIEDEEKRINAPPTGIPRPRFMEINAAKRRLDQDISTM